MEKNPIEADLGDLVNGVERLPHPLELKRRAIEGLHNGWSGAGRILIKIRTWSLA